MTEPLLLVADVGGTNTRVGLARGTNVDASSVQRFRNADAAGLEDVLQRYVASTGAKPHAAAAAAAGPLENGAVHLTNLDWAVTPDGIAKATGCDTASVLNDLQAQAHALPYISRENLTPVLQGTAPENPNAAQLVIGVGTGLNSALALHYHGQTIVPPSETGHIDLPAVTDEVMDLRDWLRERHGFAAAEEALSGRGLGHLYAWACDRAGVTNTPAKDAQTIMEMLAAADPQAVRAARAFTEILGTLSASLALIQLPFGGIYLAGGVSRAFAPWLEPLGFATAFAAKGRFSPYMAQFSVSIIEDDYAALTGSAAHLVAKL